MRPALLPVVLLALQVWPAPARDPAVFCGGECVRGQRGTAAGQAPSVPPRPPPLHPGHSKAQPSEVRLSRPTAQAPCSEAAATAWKLPDEPLATLPVGSGAHFTSPSLAFLA